MAAGAVGFFLIVEQAIAPHFAVAETCLAFEPIIELAGIRVEARLLDLISADCERRLGNQQVRILENIVAEQCRKFPGIGRVTQFFGNDLDAAAVHLSRVEQRT